ncbi:MAG: PepSY domain-containing protein [Bacteroidota bacterium]
MKKNKFIRLNRKWHRYLGLILGVQFLLWTLGGLYFSWTNIEEIRGDDLKNSHPTMSTNLNYISPTLFLADSFEPSDSLRSLHLTTILGKPFYRVESLTNGVKKVSLFNAIDGSIRGAITKEEATAIAKNKLNVKAKVKFIEYLTKTGEHHEYRERPLPAYAITFDSPANTTVYVSQEHGNVQTFRNNQWRVFDFLWMLHTMDYRERDNFNNWLLRAFSIFGIFTILSGFSLYILTSRKFKPIKK